MTCHFTSCSTVFQSYQDGGCVIMQGCVQWNHVYSQKAFHLKRDSNLGLQDQKLNLLSYRGSSVLCISAIQWNFLFQKDPKDLDLLFHIYSKKLATETNHFTTENSLCQSQMVFSL